MTAPDTVPAPPPRSGDLVLTGLSKLYGGQRAVDQVELTVPSGAFFALLGPSGCGKTTTLRMIAGLEEPSTGTIQLGEQDITGLRPYKRPVNTVFQNYALFPHLSIFENVAFGLRRRGVKDVKPQVEQMLELVELGAFGKRKPAQLSGGQQQRVALARALINRPQVLLLDEPLGALDLKLRRQMQLELKRIQTEVGITFVHVTHDQEEAMTMADTIAVMNGGLIEQLGTPAELYDLPATTFVANFLGQSNLIRAAIIGTSNGNLILDVQGRKVTVPLPRCRVTEGEVWMGIRPEKVFLAPAGTEQSNGVNQLRGGVVTDVSYVGVSTQYLTRLPWDQELTVFEQNTGARETLAVGDQVDLHWQPSHTFVLDARQDALAGVEDIDDPGGAG
ncbi:ABC transporter ATP-binding protein [Kribbella sp. NPDC050470]|uniref:ABC transporter ATP-binding protein n=1 Tax=unclassified Kribbella TaxID=2644121 RepID=UPI00379187F1